MGLYPIGDLYTLIQRGIADVMSAITPLELAEFNTEPLKASRPFDTRRDGFVMGEGAAVLVLENLEHGIKRMLIVEIYCEISGYRLSGDAYHLTAPEENGKGFIVCMKAAL